jgi:F-type H+-transporting ATPase subunit epsilon
MDGKLTFEILTPEGFDFSEEVDEVVAPGSEGEFGVLPGHIPFITMLASGDVVYKSGGAAAKRIYVENAYAEVGPDKVLILADKAEIKG